MTTLQSIRLKVRRLTGRKSAQQITNSEIDDYVNTFYLYDMPQRLRIFSLHTNFSFLTTPNVGDYPLSDIDITLPSGSTSTALNLYYNLEQPAYISGFKAFFCQDQSTFFSLYPKNQYQDNQLTGDGTTGPYTFTLANTPVEQGSLTIGTIDNTGADVQVVDSSQSRTSGDWQLINTNTSLIGSISYLTGAGTITFSNPIPSNNPIHISYYPYVAGQSDSILFYDNSLTLRPIPDKEYNVEISAYRLPTALLESADSPELKQWWQYLSFGAAMKIFEDAQDSQGQASIFPGLDLQERLVLRRTLMQNRDRRTATIYTQGSGPLQGSSWANW